VADWALRDQSKLAWKNFIACVDRIIGFIRQ
jgi:hypothetical protein